MKKPNGYKGKYDRPEYFSNAGSERNKRIGTKWKEKLTENSKLSQAYHDNLLKEKAYYDGLDFDNPVGSILDRK